MEPAHNIHPPEGYDETLLWPTKYMVRYLENTFALDDRIFDSAHEANDFLHSFLDSYVYQTDKHNYSVVKAPWRALQELRFRKEEYKYPIWQNEPWWKNSEHIRKDHFVHVSRKDSTLLAYTPDNSKGMRDTQVQIKPGRYLQRYFSEILSEKEIAFFAKWQATGKKDSVFTDIPLQFARTREEIKSIYLNGPESCMAHPSSIFCCGPIHPTEVYATEDLGIAYLKAPNAKVFGKPEGYSIARSLVSFKDKTYGRIYPTDSYWRQDGFDSVETSRDAHDALEILLRKAGFRSLSEIKTGFSGNKLLKIEHKGTFVMPYLDNSHGVDETHNAFVMNNRNPDYTCDRTDGLLADTEDDEPEYAFICSYCEEGYYDDNSTSVMTRVTHIGRRVYHTWCQDCVDSDSFYCHGYEERVAGNIGCVDVEGIGEACMPWVDRNCWQSNISGKYFVRADEEPITLSNGDLASQDESEKYFFICKVTGQFHRNSEMHPEYDKVYLHVDEYLLKRFLETDGLPLPPHNENNQHTLTL